MQFRTYMGLLAVGNLYLCLEVFALENSPRSRLLWLIGSGFFLGLTFLVRIDLGILYSTLALGSLIVYPLVDFRVDAFDLPAERECVVCSGPGRHRAGGFRRLQDLGPERERLRLAGAVYFQSLSVNPIPMVVCRQL